MNKIINIIVQCFYGNRVGMSIKEDDIDMIVLGYTSKEIYEEVLNSGIEKIDRTIVKIPNTNLVIIYNKYQEDDNNGGNVSVSIPEVDFKLHSRCICCRMNEDGSLDSIRKEDIETAYKYLTK